MTAKRATEKILIRAAASAESPSPSPPDSSSLEAPAGEIPISSHFSIHAKPGH